MEKSISAITLAGCLGVSRQAVDRLCAESVLTKDAAGRFDLKPSVRAYCEHLRRSASGRAGAELTSAAKRQSLEASAKLKAAQTKAAELKNKREARELIPFEEHATCLRQTFRLFRSSMLNLLPRIASDLNQTIADQDKIKKIVY